MKPLSDRQSAKESPGSARVERRLHARGTVDSRDWETKVVRRVERHVESLSGKPRSQSDAPDAKGWEEAALLALRRRIGNPVPE